MTDLTNQTVPNIPNQTIDPYYASREFSNQRELASLGGAIDRTIQGFRAKGNVNKLGRLTTAMLDLGDLEIQAANEGRQLTAEDFEGLTYLKAEHERYLLRQKQKGVKGDVAFGQRALLKAFVAQNPHLYQEAMGITGNFVSGPLSQARDQAAGTSADMEEASTNVDIGLRNDALARDTRIKDLREALAEEKAKGEDSYLRSLIGAGITSKTNVLALKEQGLSDDQIMGRIIENQMAIEAKTEQEIKGLPNDVVKLGVQIGYNFSEQQALGKSLAQMTSEVYRKRQRKLAANLMQDSIDEANALDQTQARLAVQAFYEEGFHADKMAELTSTFTALHREFVQDGDFTNIEFGQLQEDIRNSRTDLDNFLRDRLGPFGFNSEYGQMIRGEFSAVYEDLESIADPEVMSKYIKNLNTVLVEGTMNNALQDEDFRRAVLSKDLLTGLDSLAVMRLMSSDVGKNITNSFKDFNRILDSKGYANDVAGASNEEAGNSAGNQDLKTAKNTILELLKTAETREDGGKMLRDTLRYVTKGVALGTNNDVFRDVMSILAEPAIQATVVTNPKLLDVREGFNDKFNQYLQSTVSTITAEIANASTADIPVRQQAGMQIFFKDEFVSPDKREEVFKTKQGRNIELVSTDTGVRFRGKDAASDKRAFALQRRWGTLLNDLVDTNSLITGRSQEEALNFIIENEKFFSGNLVTDEAAKNEKE